MLDIDVNKYENLPAGRFYDLVLESETVVIDVRSEGEVLSGRIQGALNFDVSSSGFINQIENLPKDTTYLIYCRSGNRSVMACQIMAELGFKNLKNLQFGLVAWPFGTV